MEHKTEPSRWHRFKALFATVEVIQGPGGIGWPGPSEELTPEELQEEIEILRSIRMNTVLLDTSTVYIRPEGS